MNYTENYKGIKLDVQSVNLDISDSEQAEIRSAIDKISRFANVINAVDVYFKHEGSGNDVTHVVGMRVGVPGPDVFAEEKGIEEHWKVLLKSVTDKVIRQLQKSK